MPARFIRHFDSVSGTYYSIDEMIRTAIGSRNVVEFTYRGYSRVAEPHVLGIHNGKKQLLVYQTAGQSSSSLPGWKRVNVDEISTFRITAQTFLGQRAPREHRNFDTVLTAVAQRDEIAE